MGTWGISISSNQGGYKKPYVEQMRFMQAQNYREGYHVFSSLFRQY